MPIQSSIAEPEFTTTDGATQTDPYLRPQYGGWLVHGDLYRCRTCWSLVWRPDKERHTAWHESDALQKRAVEQAT